MVCSLHSAFELQLWKYNPLKYNHFKDGGAGETKQGLTQVVEPDNVINSRLSNNPNNVIQILESIENVITS